MNGVPWRQFTNGGRKSKFNQIIASTREEEDFPFPDYGVSTPGQTLRADLNVKSVVKMPIDANIVMHFKDSAGEITTFHQTKEKLNPLEAIFYGLEIKIPDNASVGTGELWVTINDDEVLNTRRKHKIIKGKLVKRYKE